MYGILKQNTQTVPEMPRHTHKDAYSLRFPLRLCCEVENHSNKCYKVHLSMQNVMIPLLTRNILFLLLQSLFQLHSFHSSQCLQIHYGQPLFLPIRLIHPNRTLQKFGCMFTTTIAAFRLSWHRIHLPSTYTWPNNLYLSHCMCLGMKALAGNPI